MFTLKVDGKIEGVYFFHYGFSLENLKNIDQQHNKILGHTLVIGCTDLLHTISTPLIEKRNGEIEIIIESQYDTFTFEGCILRSYFNTKNTKDLISELLEFNPNVPNKIFEKDEDCHCLTYEFIDNIANTYITNNDEDNNSSFMKVYEITYSKVTAESKVTINGVPKGNLAANIEIGKNYNG